MIEGFLFHRIYAKAGAKPISGQLHLTALILPHKAKATVAVFEATIARTKVASQSFAFNMAVAYIYRKVDDFSRGQD